MKFSKKDIENIIFLIIVGIIQALYFNILFLIVQAAYFLFAFLFWKSIKKVAKQYISMYVLHCVILQVLYNYFFLTTGSETYRFFLCFLVSTGAMVVPYVIFLEANSNFIANFSSKKKRPPKLICAEHLTRTQPLFLAQGEIRIVCRIDESCGKKRKLAYVNQLIGVVGKDVKKPKKKHNYYVNLWNNGTKEVRYGDYDFIEIYESNEIEDYNSVLSQLISCFYNDIEGYRPMNEIPLKIFGQLNLTKNTQRLLEQSFKNIEYHNA